MARIEFYLICTLILSSFYCQHPEPKRFKSVTHKWIGQEKMLLLVNCSHNYKVQIYLYNPQQIYNQVWFCDDLERPIIIKAPCQEELYLNLTYKERANYWAENERYRFVIPACSPKITSKRFKSVIHKWIAQEKILLHLNCSHNYKVQILLYKVQEIYNHVWFCDDLDEPIIIKTPCQEELYLNLTYSDRHIYYGKKEKDRFIIPACRPKITSKRFKSVIHKWIGQELRLDVNCSSNYRVEIFLYNAQYMYNRVRFCKDLDKPIIIKAPCQEKLYLNLIYIERDGYYAEKEKYRFIIPACSPKISRLEAAKIYINSHLASAICITAFIILILTTFATIIWIYLGRRTDGEQQLT